MTGLRSTPLSPACFLPALVFGLLMGAARPDAQGRARHHSPCPLFSPCRLLRAARLGRDPPGRRTSERAPKPGPAPLPDSRSLSSSRTPALGAAAAVGSASSWSPPCPRRRRGAPPSPPTCSAPPTLSASPPAPWCKTRASHRSSKCGSGAGGAGGAAGTCAWGLDPGGPGAPPGRGWQPRARCRTARATQAPGASSTCPPLVSGFPALRRPSLIHPSPPPQPAAACAPRGAPEHRDRGLPEELPALPHHRGPPHDLPASPGPGPGRRGRRLLSPQLPGPAPLPPPSLQVRRPSESSGAVPPRGLTSWGRALRLEQPPNLPSWLLARGGKPPPAPCAAGSPLAGSFTGGPAHGLAQTRGPLPRDGEAPGGACPASLLCVGASRIPTRRVTGSGLLLAWGLGPRAAVAQRPFGRGLWGWPRPWPLPAGPV